MRLHPFALAALVSTLTAFGGGQAGVAPVAPPPLERIADGIALQRLNDPSLLSPAGPVSVQALKLDPRKVKLEIGVAADRLPARETVVEIAARRKALAAVNAGFFVLADGKPAGLLKVRGELIAGTSRARGAVGFLERRGRTLLLFDRVVVDRASRAYHPSLGSPARDWARAGHAVAGAGLLRLDGRDLTEWADEKIAAGFDTTRHPRTLVGEDGTSVWLVTIDGRQPTLSLGMSFQEMQGLARRLGLRSALNLDGGGSTTMVIGGEIVNHPSDQTGPRPVSDAIVVLPRK